MLPASTHLPLVLDTNVVFDLLHFDDAAGGGHSLGASALECDRCHAPGD